MEAREYPGLNPFPSQGTRISDGADVDTDEAARQSPTFETAPIKKAAEFASNYLEFQSTRGLPLAFVGPNGSGKTHAALYFQGTTERLAAKSASRDRQPLQVYARYVRAESADFLSLYREIMKPLTLEVLRDLTERFLASLAGKQANKDFQDRDAAALIKEKLRRDPTFVSQLFGNYVVEQGAVESTARAFAQDSGGHADFKNALSFLLTPQLGGVAQQWLSGRTLSDDEYRKLGITSGPIKSLVMVKGALQLIASVFRCAEQPFMLCIDQFEKFVIENGSIRVENTGLIQFLVEIVPKQHGVFLLSGTDAAWSMLPLDLPQRFSDNVVKFSVLTLEEARQIIGVYLRSVNQETNSELVQTAVKSLDLWPFNDDAVREILRFGGGNIRRLVQNCFSLFDEAFPERLLIDGPFTVKVLKRRTQMGFEESAVSLEVERALTVRGVLFARDFRVNAARIDFAALYADGTPRFFVQINRAIFHNDEARQAQESLELALRIHGSATPTPLVLVIAGYVSPEILATVQNITPNVVVYRPDTFLEVFGKVIERMNKVAPTRSIDPKERERLDQQFAALKAELEKLVRVRDDEARITNQRVAEVLYQQERSREQESLEQARRDWAQERTRLEERIETVRIQRGVRQFEEMESVRESAQKALDDDQKRKIAMFFLPISAYLIFGGCWLLIEHGPSFSLQSFSAMLGWPLLAAGLLTMLITLLRPDLFGIVFRLLPLPFGSRDVALRFKDLSGPSRSFDQLRNQAMSVAVERYAPPFAPDRMLRSRNPHLRFAALLAPKSRFSQDQLLDCLRREPCAILRQLLAQRLGEWSNEYSDGPSIEIADLFASVPEMVYYVEVVAKLRPSPFWESRVTTAQRLVLGVIGGLAAEKRSERDSIALELVAALSARQPLSKRSEALLRAFHSDLAEASKPELESINLQQIREASRELSPFDEGGLGTFDKLQKRDTVDQLYLFFRHFQLLKERGMVSKR
jgi:hypothetical protein